MKVKPSTKEIMGTKQTLVDLDLEAQELVRLITEQGGELTPELEQRLELNTQQLLSKVDACVFVEEHFETCAALWKRRADAFKMLADRFARLADSRRERVKSFMIDSGRTELKGTFYRYKLSQLKPKLVITDPNAIPSECKMQVTEWVADKERIKAALEDGIEIPGATLQPVYSLRTYENGEE